MQNNSLVIGTIETSVGAYGAVLSQRGLCRLTSPSEPLTLCQAWADRWMPGARRLPDTGELAEVSSDLADYFAGKRRVFFTPLDLRGTTFQLTVWAALQAIPFGELRTYAEVARTIGRPTAVRAVGAAIGANPIALMVPCHRVIGSNGKLVGYAGGMDMKRTLLDHEQARLAPAQ